MRENTLRRSLVGVIAVAALTAGSLAGASASFAASDSAHQQPAAVSAGAVVPLATVNLGLSASQAKGVQRWLAADWSYKGGIDGQLGTNSWKAFQRMFKEYNGYTGPIDGVVGGGTVSALQRFLHDYGWGYTGPIDGKAGPGTQAAFKTFANWCVDAY